jgi:hypothetical protein
LHRSGAFFHLTGTSVRQGDGNHRGVSFLKSVQR